MHPDIVRGPILISPPLPTQVTSEGDVEAVYCVQWVCSPSWFQGGICCQSHYGVIWAGSLVSFLLLFFLSFFLGCDSVWQVQMKWIDVLGSVDNPRRQFVKIAEHSWAFFLPFSVRNWVRSDNTEQHGLRTVVLFSEVPNSRWTFAPLKSGHWHNTLHRWTCCNKSNTFLHLRDSFPNGD